MLTDLPGTARYACGFRTELRPGGVVTRLRTLADIEWTMAGEGIRDVRLSGRRADRSRIEIWAERYEFVLVGAGEAQERMAEIGRYGLSMTAPNTAEDAEEFFTWREAVCTLLEARLVVTSVQDEIRATFDAGRDFLYLDDQGLTELNGDFHVLSETLQVLSLSGNRLSRLPEELCLLERLTELCVDDNLLTELPAHIGRLTDLESLSVQHNRLRELPASIGRLTNLRWLRCNDNKLRRLPPEIGQLTRLRSLWIHMNRLTDLPPESAKLEALVEWRLMPDSLSTPLRGLKAGSNPWVHPPGEIVGKGPKAIREFLAAQPARLAVAGATTTYTVYVDDNEHRYEEYWKRRLLGSYDDAAAAIQACKALIDDDLATLDAQTLESLVAAWRRSGEDPWICSDDAGCEFDAWSYAEQRCRDIALAIEGRSRRAGER